MSPNEIEDVIRAHPSKLVTDVCVGGVSGGRLSDEKNPRAWIVLSEEGKRLGEAETIRLLDEWTKKNLSSYKWVRAGFEVVQEVGFLQSCCLSAAPLTLWRRYPRTRLGKSCGVSCRTSTRRSLRARQSYSLNGIFEKYLSWDSYCTIPIAFSKGRTFNSAMSAAWRAQVSQSTSLLSSLVGQPW